MYVVIIACGACCCRHDGRKPGFLARCVHVPHVAHPCYNGVHACTALRAVSSALRRRQAGSDIPVVEASQPQERSQATIHQAGHVSNSGSRGHYAMLLLLRPPSFQRHTQHTHATIQTKPGEHGSSRTPYHPLPALTPPPFSIAHRSSSAWWAPTSSSRACQRRWPCLRASTPTPTWTLSARARRHTHERAGADGHADGGHVAAAAWPCGCTTRMCMVAGRLRWWEQPYTYMHACIPPDRTVYVGPWTRLAVRRQYGSSMAWGFGAWAVECQCRPGPAHYRATGSGRGTLHACPPDTRFSSPSP